jgi:hypothetical protein
MAKTTKTASKTKGFDNLKDPESFLVAGPGGATHQTADAAQGSLTTKPLFAKASIADDLDEGVIELEARASIGQYIEAAKQQRVWAREARLSEGDA